MEFATRQSSSPSRKNPVIAIGGVGGSGTRAITQCLRDMGFYIGTDLNESVDNLWFTLLFKRLEILCVTNHEFRTLTTIFLEAMRGIPISIPERIDLVRSLAVRDREQHGVRWLQERVDKLLCVTPKEHSEYFGWKEPNTHIVLERLAEHIPEIRYIHVMRNGLDMAYSANQNQTKFWGPSLTGLPFKNGPAYSLHYWRRAHERVFAIGRDLGSKFLVINFDEFCRNPSKGLGEVAEFVGIEVSKELVESIGLQVRTPESSGRHLRYRLSGLARDDIAFVARCGFPIN
jgi:hypothetical protein